ncbi:MAG TPA: LysM peptidoglycan-binding domain-containing protein [Candidatus Nanopelagicales bacterium]
MATISIAAPVQRRDAARRPASVPVARRSPSAPSGYAAPTLVLPRPVGSDARPLRLTRRGRRLARTVVVALALLIALVVSTAGHASTSQAGTGRAVAATTTVVVQPGQTLWTVARGLSADADLRETVARIQELNGLASSSVRPGQQLIVPVIG